MTELSSMWVEERTFGGQGRQFWWRMAGERTLEILTVRAQAGAKRQVVRSLSQEELTRLAEFMADGAWHPLASTTRTVMSTTKPDGIGPFLYHGLGRAISHCKIAGELAQVLTRAGLWAWDGKKSRSRFRQVADDLARLEACYAARQADGSEGPPADMRRQQPRSATVRPPGFSLARSFRGRAVELRGRLASVSDGRHGGGKGQRRETAFRDFFRQHLGGRYGVGAGEVAEATGGISGQVDILIYDAHDSDPLIGDPEAMVLAAESIYAAIEVKPILDAAFLREAVETVRSVKVLPRTALDFSYEADDSGPMPGENPAPFAAVLACRGSNPEMLDRRLHEIQEREPPSLWVDAVCILDEAVIHRQGGIPGPGGWSPVLNPEPTPYAVAECGEDALLYFLTLVRRDLRRKHLWPYDPVSYARDMRIYGTTLI